MPRKPRRSAKVCPTCKKNFDCKLSHAPKVTYCSKECMAIDYRTRMRGRANPNFKNANGRVCVACGKLFSNYNKKRKYCSLSCYWNSGDASRNAKINNEFSRGRGAIDLNQKEIVDALTSLGVSVLKTNWMGKGFPDILCGWNGRNILIEIKNPNTYYGRKGLSESQKKWQEEWDGPVSVVYTIEEALAAVGFDLSTINGQKAN